jgi:hypothetical protein
LRRFQFNAALKLLKIKICSPFVNEAALMLIQGQPAPHIGSKPNEKESENQAWTSPWAAPSPARLIQKNLPIY